MKLLLAFFGLTAGPIILAFTVSSIFDIEAERILFFEGLLAFGVGWHGVYYGLVDDSWSTDKKLFYFVILNIGWILVELSGESLFPPMAE